MFEATWFRIAALSAPIVGFVVAASRGAWIAVACLAVLELVAIAAVLRVRRRHDPDLDTSLPGSAFPPQPAERCLIAVGTEATIGAAVHEALNRVRGYRPARICIVLPPAASLSSDGKPSTPPAPEDAGKLLAALRAEVERVDAHAFVESGAIDPAVSVRRLVERTGAGEVILSTAEPLTGHSLDVYETIRGLGVSVTHVGVDAN
jgi:hypothetical protein